MVLPKRCFHKLNDYPYYHFSAHVYVPNIQAPQLQVTPNYLHEILDDIWCQKNISQWDCMLPDWSEKTELQCNGTCVENCSLIIKADLEHYLMYVGVLLCFVNITVYLTEQWMLKILIKRK